MPTFLLILACSIASALIGGAFVWWLVGEKRKAHQIEMDEVFEDGFRAGSETTREADEETRTWRGMMN
jgi:hypothetical protein